MKKILLLALILPACKNNSKPNYTYVQYDSIENSLIRKKDSLATVYSTNPSQENAQAVVQAQNAVDSVANEKLKYYPVVK
jgi:hypothetical protein